MINQVLPSRPLKASLLSILGLLVAYPTLSLSVLAQQPPQPRKTVPTLPSDPVPSGVPSATSTDTDYVLGGGDRIQVLVFQVAEFSGEYLVLVDGTITLPLVGRISLAGLTVEQASNLLSQRYTPYLKRPVVSVNVIQPRPMQIAVAGEVNNPGSYTIFLEQGQTTPLVTDLIRQAGGVTTVADISQVQLRRVVDGTERVWALNLWELIRQGNINQDVTLRDGDTLVVPTQENISEVDIRQLSDANFGIQANQEINVAVVGEVFRPGAYRVVPEAVGDAIGTGGTQQTRRQPPRLSQALELAGGIRPLADLRNIEVRRFNRDGNQQIIKVDLWNLLASGDITEDIILQEGDTIIIPTASAIAPVESETLATASFAPVAIRVNIVGEVIRPGVIEVQPNTPLNQAIMTAGGFDKIRANRSRVILVRLNPNGTVTQREISVDLEAGIAGDNNPPLRNNDVVIVNRNGLTAATDTLNTIFRPIGTLTGLANIIRLFDNN
ncbi:polysaccharide export protein [Gloeothece citriformis PCC 7424]|uniref:Polysaccharide export protein n=1 Tax=Gloeothece citriformis (strain PCC 7424) TaxID=65393 RepID=B7K6X7_GLOC7|nr:SLBB domain-containing protein [Gloeothece citriformis]ACK72676.1 polysaccharide export protein [Gloeothece citriformis PCC 7424]